ncbi:MAG: starch-binding protein, partial [Bacillota bacterium]|nr:starch-binding protein [Bacillota bacterium]
STNWSTVYAYVYDSNSNSIAAWPGSLMIRSSNNIWSVSIPSQYSKAMVIFNDKNGTQIPASMQPGFQLNGSSMIYQNGNWTTYTEPTTAPTAAPTQVPTTSPVFVRGDTNLDGVVNLKDATIIQKSVVGLATLSSTAMLAGDANNDGVMNLKDATLIQKYVVGLATIVN